MSRVEERLHDAFDAICVPDDLAASTLARIEALRQEESGQVAAMPAGKSRRRAPSRRFVRFAVAACLCVAMAFAGGTAVYASESAYVEVSLDAPDTAVTAEASVELALNRFNVVVRASASDEAGEALLERTPVVGLSYEDAISSLVGDDDAQAGYVDIVVTASNQGQGDYLNGASESCLAHRSSNSYSCSHASEGERQEAQDAGMGLARYRAYLELSALDPTITLEQCQNMTLHEMRRLISELQNDDSEAPGGGQCEDCGSGTSGPSGNGSGSGSSSASAGSGNGSGSGEGNGASSAQNGTASAGSGSGAGHGAGHGFGRGGV